MTFTTRANAASDLPLVNVTHHEASAFCAALADGGAQTSLPSEAQWSAAFHARSDWNALTTRSTQSAPPGVYDDRDDVTPQRIRGLLGGVMEWIALAPGDARLPHLGASFDLSGEEQIASALEVTRHAVTAEQPQGPRLSNVGFRCTRTR